MTDQSRIIAGLKYQLKEARARDREHRNQLKLEHELNMLRATNKQLREKCSQPYIMALTKENEYLNQKVIEMGMKLVMTQKKLQEALEKLEQQT